MKKTVKIVLLLAMSVLMLTAFAACGGDGDGDGGFLGGEESVLCPLDGQTVEGEDAVGDYVLITSIDNGAASEPQSGIGKADLLVELPVEGGITRFMAFFYHSTPDTIGPIRSARHYVPLRRQPAGLRHHSERRGERHRRNGLYLDLLAHRRPQSAS